MSSRNGAPTRDLSDVAIAMLTGGPSGNTRQQGSGWFGPGQTLTPVAPEQVKGREWDFLSNYNIATRPRSYEGLPFHLLKNLARYDVVALAIETRKDQMSRLPWAIAPRKDAKGEPIAEVADAAIEAITNFFRRPDGRNSWSTWLRKLCHEQMETDTASIYPHRTNDGEDLIALELIDGTTMKPIIDDYGRIAEGPGVASYQQILKGLPAVNYESDDLIYAPRNPRAGKVYGFSPVEQIATTVDIAFRRQQFQRDYFTAGNIPDAIATVPADWSTDQTRDLQNYWDAIVSGDSSQRSGRVKFLPGGPGFAFHQFKDPDLSGKFDEYLIRHICYAFSLPPTPFVNAVNRATAQSAHDAALEEGLAPMQIWAKDLFDYILAKFWPSVPVEFEWQDDREIDAAVQEAVITGFVKSGVYTINEGRDILGKPAVHGGDVAMVYTATGYVRIDVNADAPTAGEAADQKAQQATENAAALAAGVNQAAAAPASGGQGAGATTGANVAAKPEDDKGAPAAKAATFRPSRETQRRIAKTYWGAPRRPLAQPPGGDGR